MAYSTANSTAVSVTNFGARGDGVTDNCPYIQTAINSLQSKGLPGTIFFPRGNYISSGQILVTGHNITLKGEPGSILTAINENDFAKIFVSGAGTGALVSGTVIDTLSINGGRVSSNTESYQGVINLWNTKNVTIQDCSIGNYLGIGVYTQYNNENTTIQNNRFYEYHLGFFNNGRESGCGLKYLTVDNNIFDRSWYQPSKDYFTAIKVQGPHGFPCYGHKITNNKIYAPSLLGIELWGEVKDSIVSNNYLESGIFGISIAAESQNIVVSNNVTKNTVLYGIELAESSYVTVVGNIIDGGTGKRTRDGIIINSTQNTSIVGNTVSNCNHAHITTYVSYPERYTQNINIVGNNLVQSGLYSVPFYYQNGHNINVSNNVFDCKGSGTYFVMIDSAGNSVVNSGLTIANNDFIGSVTDWGILFYLPSSSGIQNVLIENNRTYAVKSCGYGMLNYTDYRPISFLARNNYGQTGGLGYYIPDVQYPAAGGAPYGTSNVKDGFQYYGNYSWSVPGSGITGDGIWLCLWSGGFGHVNNPRVRVQNGASFDNSAATYEFWASCIPYVTSDIKHTLSAIPQGQYFNNNITQVKTISNESTAQNSIWAKIRPIGTGASGSQFSIFFSEQSHLVVPYSTYTEPADTTNNAKLYLSNQNLDTFKLSNGISFKNPGTRIYSPSSGVLVFEANAISGVTISGGGGGGTNYWGSGASSSIYSLANGGVGIGTNAPENPFHVKTSNPNPAKIESTNGGGYAQLILKSTARQFQVGVGDLGAGINVNNKFYIYDGTSGVVRTVIDATGRVGIGTTSPSATLHVTGTLRTDIPTSTTAVAGSATLPANPVGFVTVNITGANFKIPYYNI